MSTATSTIEEKELENTDTAVPAAGEGDAGADSPSTGQDGPWSHVAQAMEDAAEALKAGIGGGSASAQAVHESGVMTRVVYRTSYTMSYGVVFPVLLMAQFIPKANPVSHGLIDGGRAALDAVEKWRRAPRTGPSAPEECPEPAASPA
jgi:hypothetical protein